MRGTGTDSDVLLWFISHNDIIYTLSNTLMAKNIYISFLTSWVIPKSLNYTPKPKRDNKHAGPSHTGVTPSSPRVQKSLCFESLI